VGLREQGQEVELGGEGEGCGRFNVEGIVRGSCLLSVSITVGRGGTGIFLVLRDV